jgi:hypothetical protein
MATKPEKWLDGDGVRWLVDPEGLLTETRTARLAGCAPELLAALRNVRKFVLIENDESRQAVEQLDAAVKKATKR